MITKQQQLEFAAEHIEKWKSGYSYAVVEKDADGHLHVRWPTICTSGITKKEWQQERDKMQKQSVQTAQSAQPAPDNSWHERGELPPPETYCQFQKAGAQHGFVNCFVIGIDDLGFCVCRVDMDYHASMSASDFRPLRTEREKAIDEMIGILKAKFDRAGVDGIVVADIVDELYDAGYRKINP